MQRYDPLHELHVPHQADVVVGEQLDGGGGADAPRVQGRGMDVAALHQAEHLPGPPADLQRLPVELARERVERPHDVADEAVPVISGVRSLGPVGLLQHTRIGLRDHLLAEVHADQVLLEDVVVEHVLGALTEVDDLLAERGRRHAVGHVLRVAGAGGVIVPADATDAAGDEVGVSRVLALHEDAVAAEDRRRAVALDHLALREVDLRVDPEAPDDPGDRVPRHLDEAVGVLHRCLRGHLATSTRPGSRSAAASPAFATSVPRPRSSG